MLNLPTTIINDIAIHDNDLIVGTYGRGIWVLDDYAVLRQFGSAPSKASTRLFTPSGAVRLRRNVMYNTPFPKEVPQATNPTDGAIIYYALGTTPSSDVSIDVLDARGRVVRHTSSVPPRPIREMARPPMESLWLAPPRGLSTNVGLNRTNWDLRYDPPPAIRHGFEFNGNPGVTPMAPEGPLVLPGTYTVRLAVDGKRYTQPLIVRPDPRSHASRVTLAPQDTTSELGKAAHALTATLDSIAGDSLADARKPWDPRPPAWSLASLNGEFAVELEAQDNADQMPTRAALAVARTSCGDLSKLVARWRTFVQQDVANFNRLLVRLGKAAVPAPQAQARLCA